MKKILSMVLIAVVLFSALTITTGATFGNEVSPSIYCGPNDYKCSNGIELDVVFVVDSTGSMHDEIRTVKEELINIIGKVENGYPRPDLKVGVVTYRDYEQEENEYLTRVKSLTSDTNSVERFIRNIEANGGGDYEEAVEAGLDEAINHMNWRSNSKKIIILVGDAPSREYPRPIYTGNGNYPEYVYQYNWDGVIKKAQDKNIIVYSASGSGMNYEGINQWERIAKMTGGSYINLIYQRKNIQEHYIENDIDFGFMSEARASTDYEQETDSIMTNNLGGFAEVSIKEVAMASGVDYSLEGITGDFVKESENSFSSFLKKIFSKLIFWR